MIKATKTASHAVGKNNGMSGRDLFMFNPNLGDDDGDDDGEDDEFDLQLLRIRAEKEKREQEVAGYVGALETRDFPGVGRLDDLLILIFAPCCDFSMRHLDGLEEEFQGTHLENEIEEEEEGDEEEVAAHDAGVAGPSGGSKSVPGESKDDGERSGEPS